MNEPSLEIPTEIPSRTPINPSPLNSTESNDRGISYNVNEVNLENKRLYDGNEKLDVAGESYTVLHENLLDIIDSTEVDGAGVSLVLTEEDLISEEIKFQNETAEGNSFL